MRVCPQCGVSCDDAHKFCPHCGYPVGQVAKPSDDPLLGRTLPGGYLILELVGVGGMGRVYRSEQTNLGRTVAIKIIHPHLVGEESAALRFITEARAASRLNHPNSVSVIDFGKTSDGQLYLVMEHLRGKDLAKVAYEEGPLPFRRIVDVMRQVLAALGEAHHLAIIHRDLKPENVILETTRAGGDFVKVVDFGLAKMREERTKGITSPGIVCGTPEYMSPEQGRGDPLDARSDLYAVGVILYQLLTGRLPFEAESPTQVVLMHLSKPPPDMNRVAPERGIPQPIVDVTLRALAKEPDDRYRDADAFSHALGEALREVEQGPRRLAEREPRSAVRCPHCGATNAVAQKFCGDCGGSITLSVLPPRRTASTVALAGRRPSASPSALTPTGIEIPPSSRSLDGARLPFPLPLVGRDDDLAWLHSRRDDAKTALVAARLVGESGIGKTRLLREFLLMSAAEGDSVVVTAPDPTWAQVGTFALRRAIQSLAELPMDGGAMREWVTAGPEARRGISDIFRKGTTLAGAEPRLSADERRFAAAEALRWALTRASERGAGRRVILALDDLHAIDGASRNAFSDVIAEPPLVPVLVVAAHTPEFHPDWPAYAIPHVLTGLPPALVAHLLEEAGAPPLPPYEGKPNGVLPLYVDQYLRLVGEDGGEPPPRLADLIALRLERIGTTSRRFLQALAVQGDGTKKEQLLPLLSPELDLGRAAEDLSRRGLVEEDHDARFRIAHPLVRDVVLATIPSAVRRELHGKAGEQTEASAAPLEVRALHEVFAENSFEALILLERVSAECALRGDLAGSIMALRRALELARRELARGELDDPMRAVLIFSRKLGEALAVAGAYLDAEGVLREALDVAGPNGRDRARVLGALAQVAFGREKTEEAHAFLDEALAIATKSGEKELLDSLEGVRRALAS